MNTQRDEEEVPAFCNGTHCMRRWRFASSLLRCLPYPCALCRKLCPETKTNAMHSKSMGPSPGLCRSEPRSTGAVRHMLHVITVHGLVFTQVRDSVSIFPLALADSSPTHIRTRSPRAHRHHQDIASESYQGGVQGLVLPTSHHLDLTHLAKRSTPIYYYGPISRHTASTVRSRPLGRVTPIPGRLCSGTARLTTNFSVSGVRPACAPTRKETCSRPPVPWRTCDDLLQACPRTLIRTLKLHTFTAYATATALRLHFTMDLASIPHLTSVP